MSSLLTALLFTGCGPKPPLPPPPTPTTPTPTPTPAADPASREIWGGVNGFMPFSIRSLDRSSSLGFFAVMDDPTEAGLTTAMSSGWLYEDQQEAWEWDDVAWPEEGFILAVELQASSASSPAVISVFQHAAFPQQASAISVPSPGATTRLYALQRTAQGGGGSPMPMGWIVVQLDEGVPTSLTWIRSPQSQGPFIHVGLNQELHFLPVSNPASLPAQASQIYQEPI